MKKVLIITDGKKGHLNQSIAFCHLKELTWDILEVHFKSRAHKLLSYFLARLNIYSSCLLKSFEIPKNGPYCAIVSAGSSTYYFNRLLGKQWGLKSLAMMYPKGYPIQHFDYIIAQTHDQFKSASNVIEVPLNLSYIPNAHCIEKSTDKPALAIIIGGENAIFKMDVEVIRKALSTIFDDYPEHLKYITTSRRTPLAIESLINNYNFNYKLIYSQSPHVNPIGNFIALCDHFFITIDSTSMISEVRANSNAHIEVIVLPSKKQQTKYHRLVQMVKMLDGKVDFKTYLEKIKL